MGGLSLRLVVPGRLNLPHLVPGRILAVRASLTPPSLSSTTPVSPTIFPASCAPSMRLFASAADTKFPTHNHSAPFGLSAVAPMLASFALLYAAASSLSQPVQHVERVSEAPEKIPTKQAGWDWMAAPLAILGLRRGLRLSRPQAQGSQPLLAPSSQGEEMIDGHPTRFVRFVRGFGPKVVRGSFDIPFEVGQNIKFANPERLQVVYGLWLRRVIRVEPQTDPASQTGLFTVVRTYHTAPKGVGVLTDAGNETTGILIDVQGGRLMKVTLADHGEPATVYRESSQVKIEQRGKGDDLISSLSEFNRLFSVLRGETHPDNFYNGDPLWYFSARELSPAQAKRVRADVKRLGAEFDTPGLETLLRGLFAKDVQEVERLDYIREHDSFLGLKL